jgi:hypothetical protein
MLDLDNLWRLNMSLPWSGTAMAALALGLWAYFGLGPGQELIHFFLGLLVFAGAALVAVLQWPLLALRRFLAKRNRDTELKPPVPNPPNPTPPQSDDPGRHEQ